MFATKESLARHALSRGPLVASVWKLPGTFRGCNLCVKICSHSNPNSKMDLRRHGRHNFSFRLKCMTRAQTSAPRIDSADSIFTAPSAPVKLIAAIDRELVRKGARVVLACRNKSSGDALAAKFREETAGAHIEVRPTFNATEMSSPTKAWNAKSHQLSQPPEFHPITLTHAPPPDTSSSR